MEWEYIDDPDSPYEIVMYPEGKAAALDPANIGYTVEVGVEEDS
jgi:hypothetical protein